ncbi:MAG: LCP family protein [Clostridiales bacterium]|nr:LCP family protein [Clostridiales bacterium]
MVCLGAIASIAIIILNLVDLGISLSLKPVLLLLLVDAGLIALPFYLLGTGKVDYSSLMRICCIGIAGIMIFLNLFASSYLSATTEFLGEITSRSEGAIEYSVIAQRTAGIELSTKQSVRAGIQSGDICKKEVEQETKKLALASFEEFENLSEMIGATEENVLDIVVVQSSMLNAYKEYFPDSYKNLSVLSTFSAGTEKAKERASNAKIDITKPFAIYVSGIDEYGPIEESNGRSDMNMIVLVDPERYKVLLVNTPRDYYVQLHGTSGYKDKLAHAGMMGIEMSEQTLEDLYDLNINYHVRINFDTIINFVDSMGGITVDNPVAFSIWGNNYKAGEIYLTGDYALMYARARKGLEGGDNDRGENQQRVIEALIKRITKPSVVINYTKILTAITGTVSTNTPPKLITQLFSRQISLGGDWTIEKASAVGRNAQKPTYSMGEQELSVIIPDEEALADLRQQIRDFMNGVD